MCHCRIHLDAQWDGCLYWLANFAPELPLSSGCNTAGGHQAGTLLKWTRVLRSEPVRADTLDPRQREQAWGTSYLQPALCLRLKKWWERPLLFVVSKPFLFFFFLQKKADNPNGKCQEEFIEFWTFYLGII